MCPLRAHFLTATGAGQAPAAAGGGREPAARRGQPDAEADPAWWPRVRRAAGAVMWGLALTPRQDGTLVERATPRSSRFETRSQSASMDLLASHG